MKYLAVALASATLALGINYAQAGPSGGAAQSAQSRAVVKEIRALRRDQRYLRSYLRSITDNTYSLCAELSGWPGNANRTCTSAAGTIIE
jgi:hypothetical protein